MIIIFALLTLNYQQCIADLIGLHIIYRHGERTPTRMIRRNTQQNMPLGVLTQKGRRQHINLGRILRKFYNNIIPKEYDGKYVRIQSTDIERSLMSALANSLVLFNVNRSLPVIHTVPTSSDYLLSRTSHCPAFQKRIMRIWKQKNNTDYIKKIIGSWEYSQLKLKYKNLSYQNLFSLADYEMFMSDNINNYWLNSNSKIKEFLYRHYNYLFMIEVVDETIRKLRIGKLLNSISNYLECWRRQESKNRESDCPSHRVLIYSAHDFTIGYLLASLADQYTFDVPPFASCLIIELHQIDGYSKQDLSSYRINII